MQCNPYQALYLHIPFCKKRCSYCDFDTNATPFDEEVFGSYIDELIMSIRRASKNDLLGSIETVYLGGGTPSYIGNKQLSRLLYTLSMFMHLTPEVECTLEANPDSLTEAMVKDLFALGVTRLSLGVQSFDDSVLQTLGRIHTAQKARKAIKLAQDRFENISIDLMCGIPGQTEEMFRASLEEAVDLGIKHISVYPLTIEEGTPFDTAVSKGELNYDEDSGADMMRIASTYLEKQGMHRYEVASYAYPGFESRHNSAYWSAKPYLGLGRGAVTMKQNDSLRIREKDGQELERLDQKQMVAEDLMLAMRMTRGVSFNALKQAEKILPSARSVFESLEADGFITKTDRAYIPTEKGWLFGNVLYGRILDLAP